MIDYDFDDDLEMLDRRESNRKYFALARARAQRQPVRLPTRDLGRAMRWIRRHLGMNPREREARQREEEAARILRGMGEQEGE